MERFDFFFGGRLHSQTNNLSNDLKGTEWRLVLVHEATPKLPKITQALPVYGASQEVDLNTIQCFLKRCNKRRYTSELINIYDLLEKCDGRLLTKIKNNVNHPLHALLQKVKESSKRLRSQASSITQGPRRGRGWKGYSPTTFLLGFIFQGSS